MREEQKSSSFSTVNSVSGTHYSSKMNSPTERSPEYWKKKCAELEVALKIRNQFLSHMSHEIRTPLNSIIGLADLLTRSDLPLPEKEKIESINSASNTLLHLVNDILDLSKLQANAVNIEQKDIDISQIIQSVLKIFEEKVASQVQLKFDHNLECFTARVGDEYRIRQIIGNLLSNAIKFTQEGTITVSLEELDQDQIKISVRDTGIGISNDKIDQIFEEFKQADLSTSRKYGGTGLGLPICKKIIELMQGKIWYEKNHIDQKGSIFSFVLNLPPSRDFYISHPEDPPKQENHFQNFKSIEPKDFLVIDDAPTNLFLMKKLFESTQFQITCLESGLDAIQALENQEFSHIFLDLQMPDISGVETCQQIRKLEDRLGRLPAYITALTADAYVNEEELKKYGFNNKLVKPVKREVIFELIQSTMDQTSLH